MFANTYLLNSYFQTLLINLSAAIKRVQYLLGNHGTTNDQVVH